MRPAASFCEEVVKRDFRLDEVPVFVALHPVWGHECQVYSALRPRFPPKRLHAVAQLSRFLRVNLVFVLAEFHLAKVCHVVGARNDEVYLRSVTSGAVSGQPPRRD